MGTVLNAELGSKLGFSTVKDKMTLVTAKHQESNRLSDITGYSRHVLSSQMA